MNKLEFLNYGNNEHIAYHYNYLPSNNDIGVIFLGGFKSDMEGTKALAFEEFCVSNQYNYLRFDYFGHGKSSGKFTDGCISLWLDNILLIIDKIAKGPQILIGSSLGGWLMILATLKREYRIKALIGIASAPDFTESLILPSLTSYQHKELLDKNLTYVGDENCAYPITMDLIEDGRKHLILQESIYLNQEIHLFHSLDDSHVPCELSINLARKIASQNLEVTLLKDSGHSMSDEKSLNKFFASLNNLMLKLDCEAK